MYRRPLFSRQAKANIAAMYIAAAMIGIIIGLIRLADTTPTRVGPDYPTAATASTSQAQRFTPQAPSLAAHAPAAHRPVTVALCAFEVTDTTQQPTSSPGITFPNQPTVTGSLPTTTTEAAPAPESTTEALPTTQAPVTPRHQAAHATSTTGCR